MNSIKHYTLILATLLSLLLPVQSWGDAFLKGLDAYNSGDYATAFKEQAPLAEQGHTIAQNNLGYMYEEGHGVPQNYVKAHIW